ncbi:alanine racemase [Sphingopyxis sp. Root214]|uniref:alanine racemase n=2 Tax=unclassified Sphingopyxis TaxID=2614943 RepID=UPI0006FD3D0C|nr:alanine racemase [Sphingopyxis sp. Root214]KQZ77377.1 alanine racemase [Sphingopyxis sp. Root154]KRC09828.1 alanine racemase [Sphingopyxis sp. Root214]
MIIGGMGGGRLCIDLGAVVANYKLVAERVAPAEVGAVVKANAYGLGADEVAQALCRAGCRLFFVADLGEALALRSELPSGFRLVVLNGLPPGAEGMGIQRGVTPALNSPEQAHRWADAARKAGERLPAVLQLDSGMGRLGLATEDLASLAADAQFHSAIDLVMVMSHLACAETTEHPANAAQLACFEAAAAMFSGVPRSLANSGGAFLPADFHGDVVRAGIALYGGAPNRSDSNPMQPVVGLDARVIQIRTIEAGGPVGYGHSHYCARESRIATIGVGYADGLPRSLGNRGAAWLAGERLPIVGRVSMDSITIDVTALPYGRIEAGDWVKLIGPHQSLDTLANDAGTISYEILTSLGARYDRSYVNEATGVRGEAA